MIVSEIQSSLSTWAASQANNALSAAALEQIYQVQANLIINSSGEIVGLDVANMAYMIFFIAPILEEQMTTKLGT